MYLFVPYTHIVLLVPISKNLSFMTEAFHVRDPVCHEIEQTYTPFVMKYKGSSFALN